LWSVVGNVIVCDSVKKTRVIAQVVNPSSSGASSWVYSCHPGKLLPLLDICNGIPGDGVPDIAVWECMCRNPWHNTEILPRWPTGGFLPVQTVKAWSCWVV